VWVETPEFDTLFHFRWAPVSQQIKYPILGTYGQIQLVSHILNHKIITTKDQLYINLYKYSEQTAKRNVFDFMPITFLLEQDT
jgi:hypothetical protein